MAASHPKALGPCLLGVGGASPARKHMNMTLPPPSPASDGPGPEHQRLHIRTLWIGIAGLGATILGALIAFVAWVHPFEPRAVAPIPPLIGAPMALPSLPPPVTPGASTMAAEPSLPFVNQGQQPAVQQGPPHLISSPLSNPVSQRPPKETTTNDDREAVRSSENSHTPSPSPGYTLFSDSMSREGPELTTEVGPIDVIPRPLPEPDQVPVEPGDEYITVGEIIDVIDSGAGECHGAHPLSSLHYPWCPPMRCALA